MALPPRQGRLVFLWSWFFTVTVSQTVSLGEEGSERLADDEDRAVSLADDIQCGVALARDLLMLAGGDAQLVRQASASCRGVESMKAYIIDHRFDKLERY